ncbi:hypothetical protein CERSUDRAFT_113105 [Gelatoporia subvermispora B]|uniref:Uncharacterized protein n=1 Tax=Ceriporiopsis subvermispora (strain B) TaxID=914234 RepID=M2R0G1_CERS8|nr:hypothetical protein CERSUDRAFT_113105 [Gelatoporia subvermispora B]
MPPVLLSRRLDPLLGVFTGVFAYYLYESHPRNAVPPEERLTALIKWKYNKWRNEREQRLTAGNDDEIDLKALAVEVEK